MDSVQRIGVVTVTYNSAEVLPEFLASVASQTFREFFLYVVDNASKDNSIEIASACGDPRVRILANAVNLGVAEGNNQGIRAALADGCDAVLLLNNDTVFPPDLFAILGNSLEKYQSHMTTGKMLLYEPPDQIWCAGGWFDSKRFFGAFHYGMGEKDIGQYDQPRQVTYTPTCCLLVRSSVFNQVGMMDGRYFVYNDDVDFLYRCLQQGLSLWYIPSARLFHKISSLTGGDESEFAIHYMTRNRAYFLRKHLPIWQTLSWGVHFLLVTAPTRLLSGRDSFKIWRLRCASMLEGLQIPHE